VSPPLHSHDLADDWQNVAEDTTRNRCHEYRVPLDMSRIYPECHDSYPSDRSVPADVLLRQEPVEEEDEEEDESDDKEDDDDDDKGDDGYSE
jgi:hypothetical protein